MKRIACPLCCKGKGDRTVMVFDSGRVHCFRGCDWREVREAMGDELPELLDTAQHFSPVEPHHDGLAEWAQTLWQSTLALDGVAVAYLKTRACAIPPADGDLRWHPEVKHKPTGHVGPALIGLVTDAETNKPISLHRTWIRRDGSKPVKPARMLAAGHRARNGVIRLWPDEAVTHGLAVAEGIETALSVAHGYTPVWSCIDAGNLASLPVLAGIESLLIAADNDPAGTKAARECALRWHEAGREVFCMEPKEPGTDFNDVVAA